MGGGGGSAGVGRRAQKALEKVYATTKGSKAKKMAAMKAYGAKRAEQVKARLAGGAYVGKKPKKKTAAKPAAKKPAKKKKK